MKTFSVSYKFTDRVLGPGAGKTIRIEASTVPSAISKTAREFWSGLGRKSRFDVAQSGLTITITKVGVALALALLLSLSASAQTPRRIALTATSNVPFAVLADLMEKNCAGEVTLTLDPTKADYLLEAATTERLVDGDSMVSPHFTLFSRSGDVLFHTATRHHNAFKNAMKGVCNFIATQGTK